MGGEGRCREETEPVREEKALGQAGAWEEVSGAAAAAGAEGLPPVPAVTVSAQTAANGFLISWGYLAMSNNAPIAVPP